MYICTRKSQAIRKGFHEFKIYFTLNIFNIKKVCIWNQRMCEPWNIQKSRWDIFQSQLVHKEIYGNRIKNKFTLLLKIFSGGNSWLFLHFLWKQWAGFYRSKDSIVVLLKNTKKLDESEFKKITNINKNSISLSFDLQRLSIGRILFGKTGKNLTMSLAVRCFMSSTMWWNGKLNFVFWHFSIFSFVSPLLRFFFIYLIWRQ